ncbi:unnamed protein product [Meloidogyne enterolobii]|uniref:Uncharacterized protein n=1 Tax=Meloidogyne enterolobii TaxID=390850 RepID=A0ACB1AG08_MELEN
MLQTYKEQHQEIDRFRRKNIINEIKNGEPVFWCATQSSALWKFPSKEEATFCNKDKFRKWKNFGFETFSQITHPEPVEGLICSAKYTKETYYTNFLGDKFLKLEQNLLPISKEDCLKIRENKICPLNKKIMEKKDGIWKTEEVLNIDFPGRFSSFFWGEKSSEVVNCMLQPTTLHYNPQTLEMVSPLFEIKKCHFMTDFCQLSDNSSLIWEANCETRNCKSCFYEYLGRWEGDYTQANERIVWISNTKEIALSFNYEASREMLAMVGL